MVLSFFLNASAKCKGNFEQDIQSKHWYSLKIYIKAYENYFVVWVARDKENEVTKVMNFMVFP